MTFYPGGNKMSLVDVVAEIGRGTKYGVQLEKNLLSACEKDRKFKLTRKIKRPALKRRGIRK